MELPKGVHRVLSRGMEYYYFQERRGAADAGPRIPLGKDPRSPEFWSALRQAQGLTDAATPNTLDSLIDIYVASPEFRRLAPGSQDQYTRGLKLAREAWGKLPARNLRPVHVRAMMSRLSETPGKANIFFGALRALSSWARARDHIDQTLCDGIKPYPPQGGHKPWTPRQIACAHECLTGHMRRHIMLALYTGQRGSDVVRLCWTDIDDGGFRIRQLKTGREIWCPIVPELEAEMRTWERTPGPFVRQESGKQYTRKLFSKHFATVRDSLPDLAGVTLHGLRATAVVRLREYGLSTPQIQDIIGMSLAMIERYSRFADKKASGKAALVSIEQRRNETVKRVKTVNMSSSIINDLEDER